MPLLIGGATTSRVHTAVKIDPNYRGGPVMHVNDASRAVGVVSSLMSPERREAYAAEVRAEYAKISAAHFRAQADKKRLTLAAARANAVADRLAQLPPPSRLPRNQSFRRLSAGRASRGRSTGRRSSRPGNWPGAFQRSSTIKVGEVARSLYDDARKMLDRIVKEKWFKAQA